MEPVLAGLAACRAAGLGPGPRDGLMTGLAARGHSIRGVRTGIEATVLLIGWLLGGNVGIGTVVYAACIGPIAHIFVPLFSRKPAAIADRDHQPDLLDPEVSRISPGTAAQTSTSTGS